MSENESSVNFNSFGLSDALLKVLEEVGYEVPTAIQEQCITHLLNGHDVIGQAQTGTGKTAAFALPLIDRIDLNNNQVQLLVLPLLGSLLFKFQKLFKPMLDISKDFMYCLYMEDNLTMFN